ncbi:hypothetical protein B1C78_11285 [Thioalkalivibrio denitrificans]|uniref:Magnesium transporter MgtE intracellular domain-containing protein n=1 Tax=Thioalkalivibrio denitrificans TaxID=108003 RepID=A0A1V3NEE7_9GAMM|nr:hypothetical protein [Thioalkalivibrio denitrificans]OOG23440.1 hypothetical protein B1C78_11285 [Thioalkalivibrio denitrificans]
MTTLFNKALDSIRHSSPDELWRQVDAAIDMDVDTVSAAMRKGAIGTARLRFLRLAEQSQIRVLERIDTRDAVRLAGGLPTYTVARLYERLPRKLGKAIVQALPEGKRRGVVVILNHRRQR